MKLQLLCLLVASLSLSQITEGRPLGTSGSCNANGKLQLSANAPLLSSGTFTQLSMASLFTSTGQPTTNLVTVVVTNSDSKPQTFRILFELKAIPSDARIRSSCHDPLPSQGGEGCWIQRMICRNITLPGGSSWVRTSSELELEPYQASGIQPENSPFKQMLSREGFLPPGAIYMNVALLCPASSGAPLEDLTQATNLAVYSGVADPQRHFMGSYQPTKPPTLLFPGSPATESFPPNSTSTPTFLFAGNLDGVNLGGESAYRLSIWEVRPNQALGEALDGSPLHTVKVSQSPVVWSGDWAPLEPGKRYAWRVDGLLKGLATDWLPSDVYGFSIPQANGSSMGSTSGNADAPQAGATMGVSLPPGSDPPHPTPEQLEILQSLSLIIGSYRPILEPLLRTSLPDPNGLRIGSTPVTRGDFQTLVRDILEGRATVTGAETHP